MKQIVQSNYMIRALNAKQHTKVLDSAFESMREDEEHVLSGVAGSGDRLPYICTSHGLYFGEMRKEGFLKKVPVHVFVPRERVHRAELVQVPGYSFTSLRGYDANGTQVVGMSFDELSGNDNMDGEAQARIIVDALGIHLG